MNAPAQAIARYVTEIDEIYRTGNATEHSYQPALKTLFESCFTSYKTPLKGGFTGLKTLFESCFTSLKTPFESCFTSLKTPLKGGFTGPKNGLTITNEPKHIECGAPDYIITRIWITS
jgi:hypothetical protein